MYKCVFDPSIIATPGRFMHVVVEMNLKLKSIQYVVFDEADRWVHTSLFPCRFILCIILLRVLSVSATKNPTKNYSSLYQFFLIMILLQILQYIIINEVYITCFVEKAQCCLCLNAYNLMRICRKSKSIYKIFIYKKSYLHILIFFHRLFEMGFQEQLTETLSRLPESRQTLLFSATLPKLLVQFAKAGLHDPTLVRLDVETKLSENLKVGVFYLPWSKEAHTGEPRTAGEWTDGCDIGVEKLCKIKQTTLYASVSVYV